MDDFNQIKEISNEQFENTLKLLLVKVFELHGMDYEKGDLVSVYQPDPSSSVRSFRAASIISTLVPAITNLVKAKNQEFIGSLPEVDKP